MALCRCKKHKPKGRNNQYNHYVEPIDYPITSSICGRKNCNEKGLIWLTNTEYLEYHQNDTRIFSYASAVTKVEVK